MSRIHARLDTIESFLAQKRIALVGISREHRNIGPELYKEFRQLGYEVFPVNPNTSQILGERCYARVQDIQPAPDAALLLTTPVVTDTVVQDCAEAGIRHVWMYRGGGQGAVSDEAVEFCHAHGIEVVTGECPFMFLPPVHGVHRFHRFFVKITGHYPKRLQAVAG